MLAEAVLELYPGVKISIGPRDRERLLLRLRLPGRGHGQRRRLRADRGAGCASTSTPTSRSCARTSPSREALERFRAEDQPYKVELIEDLVNATEGVETVSLYTNGPFTDLCRGPHAPSTKRIKAFKLQSVAGAYWRGDSSRQMLTRVYGTAFFSARTCEEYLERLERARANDHRRLGPQLGLFTFSEVAPGSAFWLPAGTEVFNSLVELSREMGATRGYTEVKTPLLFDRSLWETSGHWDKYARATCS